MEKLLEDLLCWDQEKEDNHLKITSERDRLTDEITKQRAVELKEKRRLYEEEQAKLASQRENEEDEAEEEKPADDEENAEKKEDEEEQEARPESKFSSVNKPIEVKVDGESDDDFEFIEIKEKVKTYVKTHGGDKRIPDELINEAVRWRLNKNDCQNRGYVLEGYPKSF